MIRPVSVVIPVYNRPAAVARAIASVLAQTYRDFEVVVVDDGSTDETASVVAAMTDERIRLVRNDRRGGGAVARNIGIRASAGEYVAFLDSDDEWFPPKLERQLETFSRHGDRLGLVYTGVERVYDDGTVVQDVPRPWSDLRRALLLENVIGETSLGMVPRRVLDVVGEFDERLPSSQDLDLWLRVCAQFEVAFVPDVLVRVTKAEDKGRISVDSTATIRGRDLFGEKYRDELLRHGLLHLYLRESGWWRQRRARDPRAARALYRESLALAPFSPVTYALFLAACLPPSWLDVAAGVKHRFTACTARSSWT